MLISFLLDKLSTFVFYSGQSKYHYCSKKGVRIKVYNLGFSPKQPGANNKMGSESSYLTNFAKFPAVSGAEYPSIMTYISKQPAPIIILQMS